MQQCEKTGKYVVLFGAKATKNIPLIQILNLKQYLI